jgi:CRISPR/Cas system-associated endonuclease Cas1
MATLYVTEPGARLEKEYRRLRVVDSEGKTLLVTPLARLSEVALVGRVGATTPALLTLLDAGIGLTFLTRQGRLRGRLTPPTGKNLPLRRRQYQRADDPAFSLRLSRAIVGGKLRNSRTMARPDRTAEALFAGSRSQPGHRRPDGPGGYGSQSLLFDLAGGPGRPPGLWPAHAPPAPGPGQRPAEPGL